MRLKVELPGFAHETIVRFIKDFVGDRRVVIGLSGGLDSSVALALAVEALGKEKVLAVHMPDAITPKTETDDAETVAGKYGVALREIRIDSILEKLLEKTGVASKIAVANAKARIRMMILYSFSNELNGLVLGTSNKSELLTGYFTKYGDGASDLAPIGDLYKTQVRKLAKEIGIPEKIIKKKPSANLIPGQVDEEELGVDYETLDRVLYGIELGLKKEEIAREIENERVVNRVFELYHRSRHKRVLIYIPKIGIRSINTDWRE